MQGKIKLYTNVKLDKSYINIIAPNESVASFMNWLDTENYLAELDHFSFLREDRNSIRVELPYYRILTANYIAFQNTDYGNKWFFGFVDKVRYISNAVTEVQFTIDVWSTWHEQFTASPTFIKREHTVNDTIGANTLPEPVAYSDYQVQEIDHVYPSELVEGYYYTYIVVCGVQTEGQEHMIISQSGDYGNGTYFRFAKDIQTLRTILEGLAGQTGAVVNIFAYPRNLFGDVSLDESNYIETITKNTTGFNKTIEKPTDLNGYVPKNKKMLTSPFCFLEQIADGQIKTYKYEFFDRQDVLFRFLGGLSCTPEVLICPVGYNGYGYDEPDFADAISVKDYTPQISSTVDSYQAWIANNSRGYQFQQKQRIANAVVGGVESLLSMNIGGALISPIKEIGNTINDWQAQQMYLNDASDHIMGNSNASVQTVLGYNGAVYRKVALKKSEAQKADEFLSMFGYNTNEIKIPNVFTNKHRINWDYIQIATECGHGEIPADAMEEIQNILRRGTTIWWNKSKFGDYGDFSNSVYFG